ncbi:MAG: hypothetical protein JST42_17875 [Bacteroidetes bacterium]|nr:hypothetical protein [Bacteroidota bacterium]
MSGSPNGVIVFKTRYGTTLQYADWIRKELKTPLIDPERVDGQVLSHCDFLVIGTPVYMGKMLIADWLEDNQEFLRRSRLFLFVVCTYFSDSEKQQAMIRENIPESLLACCKLFFLQGRLIVDKLSEEDARLVAVGDGTTQIHNSDPVHKANIIPLVEAVWAYSARDAFFPK